MNIVIHPVGEIKIAEILSENILIREVQDALDLMADCSYMGAGRIILHENSILPDFFELQTGLAGEILQKFSNYKVKLAIIGDFSKYARRSLMDFMYESNKQGHINFVGSLEKAIDALTNE
jgi:hypothetical protein